MQTIILLLALSQSNLLAVLQQVGRRGASNFFDNMEAAAFIVQNSDGSYTAVSWAANTAGVRTAHYEGAIPPGTIAIAHTHPFTSELPSRGDIAQAKKMGLPIYTISQWSLYVAEPSGKVVPVIVRHNWLRAPKAGGTSRGGEIAAPRRGSSAGVFFRRIVFAPNWLAELQ